MTCKEVIKRLSEYWSNELDEGTKDEITSHLQSCPSCQGEWAVFQAAMNALRNVNAPEPPPELLSRIQNAVRERRHRKPAFVWRWQWSVAACAAAIAVAIVSVPVFNLVREKATLPRRSIAMVESPRPLFLPPNLERPSQPTITESTPSLKLPPSPAERIAKPPRAKVAERSELEWGRKATKGREAVASEGATPPEPAFETPALGVPSGEKLPNQPSRDILADIAPQREQNAPKLAELPFEPRVVPFRAEAELSKGVQVPGAETAERAYALKAPASPPVQPGPTETQSPAEVAPMAVEPQKGRVRTPAPVPTVQPSPMKQQYGGYGGYGGGVGQTIFAIPFSLRWAKFEPVVVGKVRLWQLALSSDIPQIVTVFLQPGEKVEILNAQQPPAGEGRGLLVWRDKVSFGREVFVPVLIRANEIGTRKVLVTVETADGRTFSWWCIFPAMTREEQPRIRRPVNLQIEQWTVFDLLAHLAWENKVAFLLPEPVGQRTLSVPTGTVSLPELLTMIERQIGLRWQRFGNTFSLFSPAPFQVAPAVKQ